MHKFIIMVTLLAFSLSSAYAITSQALASANLIHVLPQIIEYVVTSGTLTDIRNTALVNKQYRALIKEKSESNSDIIFFKDYFNQVALSEKPSSSPILGISRHGILATTFTSEKKDSPEKKRLQLLFQLIHTKNITERAASLIIQKLIFRGVDINAPGQSGCTPLCSAIANHNVSIMHALINNGVQPNNAIKIRRAYSINHDAWTPLILAADVGNIDSVLILIKQKALLNQSTTYIPRRTALMIAAQNGHTDILRILLEAGAEIACTDDSDQNALYYACKAGHINCAQLLIEAGASVEVKHKYTDFTLLMVAIASQNTELVNLLIRSGVNVNALNKAKETALIMATRLGNEQMVKYLLDAGATVLARGPHDWTALMEADHKGHDSIVPLLFYAREKEMRSLKTLNS